jgi:hypothetical protein
VLRCSVVAGLTVGCLQGAHVGEPEGGSADPPVPALHLFEQDPGMGSDGFAGERHDGVGDGGDDGGSLGVGELFLEELDLDEWHDFSLGLMTLGSGRGGQHEDAGEGDGHVDALLALAKSIGAAPSLISCLCVAS